jgi:hypothetical protein
MYLSRCRARDCIFLTQRRCSVLCALMCCGVLCCAVEWKVLTAGPPELTLQPASTWLAASCSRSHARLSPSVCSVSPNYRIALHTPVPAKVPQNFRSVTWSVMAQHGNPKADKTQRRASMFGPRRGSAEDLSSPPDRRRPVSDRTLGARIVGGATLAPVVEAKVHRDDSVRHFAWLRSAWPCCPGCYSCLIPLIYAVGVVVVV